MTSPDSPAANTTAGRNCAIEGHFPCGPGILADVECMGRTYITHTAKLHLQISFPTLGADWQRGVIHPPEWTTVAKTAEADKEQIGSTKWGSILGWWNKADGTQTPRTVTVARWRFATNIHVADEVNDYHHARSAAMGEIENWWLLFSSWLSVITGQDLTERGEPDRGIKSGPVWVWEQSESGVRQRASRETTFGFKSIGDVAAADHRTLTACMALSGRSKSPPDEWLFIRDAKTLLSNKQHRRAVIDAGTAAELAITTLLDRKLAGTDETVKRLLLDKYQTLNGRAQLLKKIDAGVVPDRLQQELSEPRNDAAHGGATPTLAEAKLAIAKALELVEQAHPVEGFLSAE